MRKVRSVLLTGLCMMLLGGCGLIPEVKLSDEDSVLVAEYAAGLLLKYETQHHNGLMEITDDPIMIETPTPEPTVAASGDAAAGEDTSGLIADMNATAPALAAAIGIPDFLVTYTGYEICDIYPEQDSDELVFAMQAQQGRKLLILHFNLENPTENAMDCDVVTGSPLFRALLNEDLRINSQTTILLNDLSVYSGTLEGNEAVDTVVVFEIEESTAAELNKISLLIVNHEDEFTYQLQ